MGLFPSRQLAPGRFRELRHQAMDIYASYGITTAQDSNLSPDYVETLREEAESAPFPIDVVSFITANNLTDEELAAVRHDSDYAGGFRNGGVKFILDGSPQGRTAWMSQPYTEGPPGAAEDYVAYPSYEPQAWLDRIGVMLERGMPVLAHANGDAAIELMIDGIDDALADGPAPDHRSVIIHAQLIRADQLDRLPALGSSSLVLRGASLFLGRLAPASVSVSSGLLSFHLRGRPLSGISFTNHNDLTDRPPDMMRPDFHCRESRHTARVRARSGTAVGRAKKRCMQSLSVRLPIFRGG